MDEILSLKIEILITADSGPIYPIKKGKRKVQGVPQSQTTALPRPQEEEETPNSITLVLLGILPLESVIHKNTLILHVFMSIASNNHFTEYEAAERQLVMKHCNGTSWFNLINKRPNDCLS